MLWVILWRTLSDFGVVEENLARRPSAPDTAASSLSMLDLLGDAAADVHLTQNVDIRNDVSALRQVIEEEALAASLRISALAGVLSANFYLRLDPSM